MKPLFPFQDADADRLAHGGAKLLFSEQGTGKSRVAIETARRLGAKRILVICPATVRLVWRHQFSEWWPGGPKVNVVDLAPLARDLAGPGVTVVNYDKFSQSRSGDFDFTAAFKAAGEIEPWDATILDECHYLANLETIRTKAVYKALMPYLGRIIPASGTPAPSHSGQLYSTLRAVAPEVIMRGNRPMMLYEFEELYCTTTERYINGRHRRVITGSKNMAQLRALLEPIMVRRTKAEVLPELPPIQFEILPIAVSAEGAASLRQYQHLVGPGMSDELVLEALRSGDEHIMRLRAATGYAKVSGAISYLVDFLESNPAEKVVVWGIHTNVIDRLMTGLAGFGPVKIDGRDNQAARINAVDQFLTNDSCRVFVGNIAAGGTGITLIGPKCRCTNAFFVEADFVPGNNLQAAARIHRIGAHDGVLVQFFTAAGTIDDRIQSILRRKTAEINELFN